jgi:hypothetical protein
MDQIAEGSRIRQWEEDRPLFSSPLNGRWVEECIRVGVWRRGWGWEQLLTTLKT